MMNLILSFLFGVMSVAAFIAWGARRYEAGFQDGLGGRRETREEAKTR